MTYTKFIKGSIIFVLFFAVAESKQLMTNTGDVKELLISISKLSPQPNYSLSTDENDIQQLTDTEILRFPIWSKKGCVGWHKRTPVKISAKIEAKNNNGVLKIHTAKGLYAGVKGVRRVDVYSKTPSNQYIHVGEYHGQTDEWEDRKNHWININVYGAYDELEIVVHADGTNIFIDEIEWIPGKGVDGFVQENLIPTNQIIKDSTNRLKTALLEDSEIASNFENNGVANLSKSIIWQDDPWGDLSGKPPVVKSNLALTEIKIIGVKNEKESAVLGVFNAENDGEYNVTISSNQEINAQAIKIGIVKSILTASGVLVFDPILPIKQNETFKIEANKVSYIWLTIDLEQLQETNYQANILVSSDNLQAPYSIPLTIDVVNKAIVINEPAAINWSYTSNLPIWKNRKKTMEDLLEHGINVFVVPPQHIPQPNVDGNWNIGAAIRLKKDLDLFKGNGQILLIVGWGPGSRPAWMFNDKNLTEQRKFEILKNWLNKLNTYMTQQGFHNSEWALYPVDEAHSKKLDFLIKIAKWIKQANPDIRVYANPSQSRRGYATYRDLKILEPLIDIWQPSLAFAQQKGNRFFSEMETPWWVYDNPKAPVKQSSPFKNYRRLAWKAWNIGSSGIGFWSYSDTQGSSAWDDFDGVRADWAVVYESEEKPVSSRRWEAFREGVEDYKLLTKTENMDCFPRELMNMKQGMINNYPSSSQALEQVRKQMLSCLKEH